MPEFLSTLSLRRATTRKSTTGQTLIFLSTLSLRRATFFGCNYPFKLLISIHALLAESDGFCDLEPIKNPISIHALLAESDPMTSETVWVITVFLSTLSLRRATIGQMAIQAIHKYFYPRSPCGERRSPKGSVHDFKLISIHALLAESDLETLARAFLSHISIHALLAESDN